VECLASGAIPESIQEEIKNGILNAIFKQLIESYSKIRKVSEHGREIMLSDFSMIVGGLGKLVQPEVDENKKNCEEYIKAWHKSTEELKDFIVANYERYSLKALHGLMQSHITVKSLNRQQRRDILKEIEDLDIKFLRENI